MATDVPPADEPTPLYDVFVLDRAVTALLDQAMADSPLRPLEYAIYGLVEQDPGCTATELAKRLSVPLTTMADWLAPIIDRGHLERRRSERDRRSFGLELTAAGRAALGRSMDSFGVAYRAFAEHSRRPVGELREVLGEMIEAAQAAADELRSR